MSSPLREIKSANSINKQRGSKIYRCWFHSKDSKSLRIMRPCEGTKNVICA